MAKLAKVLTDAELDARCELAERSLRAYLDLVETLRRHRDMEGKAVTTLQRPKHANLPHAEIERMSNLINTLAGQFEDIERQCEGVADMFMRNLHIVSWVEMLHAYYKAVRRACDRYHVDELRRVARVALVEGPLTQRDHDQFREVRRHALIMMKAVTGMFAVDCTPFSAEDRQSGAAFDALMLALGPDICPLMHPSSKAAEKPRGSGAARLAAWVMAQWIDMEETSIDKLCSEFRKSLPK